MFKKFEPLIIGGIIIIFLTIALIYFNYSIVNYLKINAKDIYVKKESVIQLINNVLGLASIIVFFQSLLTFSKNMKKAEEN